MAFSLPTRKAWYPVQAISKASTESRPSTPSRANSSSLKMRGTRCRCRCGVRAGVTVSEARRSIGRGARHARRRRRQDAEQPAAGWLWSRAWPLFHGRWQRRETAEFQSRPGAPAPAADERQACQAHGPANPRPRRRRHHSRLRRTTAAATHRVSTSSTIRRQRASRPPLPWRGARRVWHGSRWACARSNNTHGRRVRARIRRGPVLHR
jgi:hypothetical protein